jgi:hypothetical protein
MVVFHFRFSCARHGSWDVVWVSDVSFISYGRMDKELRGFIADKKFNRHFQSYVLNISRETKIT